MVTRNYTSFSLDPTLKWSEMTKYLRRDDANPLSWSCWCALAGSLQSGSPESPLQSPIQSGSPESPDSAESDFSWLVKSTSHPYPECWLPGNFQAIPENSSLPSSLNFCCFFFIKKHNIFALSLTSPCLASFCSEQCMKRCITSTSCDCLPLYNVLQLYSSIVSRFG